MGKPSNQRVAIVALFPLYCPLGYVPHTHAHTHMRTCTHTHTHTHTGKSVSVTMVIVRRRRGKGKRLTVDLGRKAKWITRFNLR